MQRRHVFLSPGVYDLGGGRTWEFSSGELKRIVSNTLDLQARGFRVPVFVGHRPVGDAAGGPVLVAENDEGQDADTESPRVGWLSELWQNDDGGLEYELDFDPEADSGELPEFTSPEIRREVVLEDGTAIGPVIAHVALTDRPRNRDQRPLDEVPEAVQFSLADLIREEAAPRGETTEALLQRIGQSKVLGPALRRRLQDLAGTIQLSGEGDSEPRLSLSETLSLLEETLPESPALDDSLRREHPGGEEFFEGAGLTDRQAAEIAKGQLSRAGLLAAR